MEFYFFREKMFLLKSVYPKSAQLALEHAAVSEKQIGDYRSSYSFPGTNQHSRLGITSACLEQTVDVVSSPSAEAIVPGRRIDTPPVRNMAESRPRTYKSYVPYPCAEIGPCQWIGPCQ